MNYRLEAATSYEKSSSRRGMCFSGRFMSDEHEVLYRHVICGRGGWMKARSVNLSIRKSCILVIYVGGVASFLGALFLGLSFAVPCLLVVLSALCPARTENQASLRFCAPSGSAPGVSFLEAEPSNRIPSLLNTTFYQSSGYPKTSLVVALLLPLKHTSNTIGSGVVISC
jgi:hypothetical protein